MNNCKRITIIILNYNGYEDTIECLSSIREIDYPLFNVILIDNASAVHSVKHLSKWAGRSFAAKEYSGNDINGGKDTFSTGFNKEGEELLPQLLLIQNANNIGFAAGCNQGIRIALSNDADYIWLLNNDTVVEPDSLSILADYLNRHSSCQVTTPQIRLLGEPDTIWNCGGDLKWYGVRKYHYVHRPAVELPEKETLDITFVTGCAILLRSSLIRDHGGFTEKFFFGEEDFEFSLRMKKTHAKMVCCLKSVIYHKVGASIDRTTEGYNIKKAYVHYLNRFINLRSYWPNFFWQVWRVLYVGYIYLLLGKVTDSSRAYRCRFIVKLLKDSSELDRVDKKSFFNILNTNTDYFQKS